MADACVLAAQVLAECLTKPKSLTTQPPTAPIVATQPSSPSPTPASAAVVAAPTTAPPSPFPSRAACEALQVPLRQIGQCAVSTATVAAPRPVATPAPAEAPAALGGLSAEGSQGRLQPLVPMLPRFSRPSASAHTVVAVSEGSLWGPRPQTGSQLYSQRQAALRAGQLFTRIAPGAFREQWQSATAQPTHRDWQALLRQEARALAAGQGNNRLTVVVGDSLSLWLPSEALPRDRFWLNQSISGETTSQMLQRIPSFADTRPDTIYVMAGVNDLKNGTTNRDLVNNMRLLVHRLRQQHPEARIVVHSILPTRLANIPSARVRLVNQIIAHAVQQQGAEFVDLQPQFTDEQGNLHPQLTTDGVHLNPDGYRIWQTTMVSI